MTGDGSVEYGGAPAARGPDDGRPVELRDDGLLWLINKAVFHPRGYALGYIEDTREFFLLGDGTEAWTMGGDVPEDMLLSRIRELMP